MMIRSQRIYILCKTKRKIQKRRTREKLIDIAWVGVAYIDIIISLIVRGRQIINYHCCRHLKTNRMVERIVVGITKPAGFYHLGAVVRGYSTYMCLCVCVYTRMYIHLSFSPLWSTRYSYSRNPFQHGRGTVIDSRSLPSPRLPDKKVSAEI